MNQQHTTASEKSTRTILINQPQNKKYPLNVIKTAKYTL